MSKYRVGQIIEVPFSGTCIVTDIAKDGTITMTPIPALDSTVIPRLEKLEKVVSEHLGEHRAVNSVFSPDDILKELRSIVERIVAVKSVFIRQKRYATGAEIRNVERVLLDFIERLS
jgi:hypothetical protein